MHKKENAKGIWLSLGTLKMGFPDQVLKLNKPLPKGIVCTCKIARWKKRNFYSYREFL